MINGRLAAIVVVLLLGIGARAAEYATAFKDKAKETRTYRAQLEYKFDGLISLAESEPFRAGMRLDSRWDAREKVISTRKDVASLSYELLKGTEQGEALGELAEDAPEDAKYEGEMEPLAVTYTRSPSGSASKVKCTEGELPYLADDDEVIGSLGPFFSLAYPFGHGLVFPAATGQEGDAWSEETTINMPAPSPDGVDGAFAVKVTRRYVIDGARQIDGRELLQVTCTIAGKRGPGLQEWDTGEGEMAAVIIGGVVDGKITYLFDSAAGVLHRVTADITATLELKQEDRSAKLTETLNTRVERVKK